MHDTVTELLSKYPYSLCLIQDREHFNENILQLENFIAKYNKISLPFSSIAKIYPEALPSTSGRAFKSIINELLD